MTKDRRFAINLRTVRIARGFTQRELSKKIEMNPRRIDMIEGFRCIVGIEEAIKICGFLDVDLNKMLTAKAELNVSWV